MIVRTANHHLFKRTSSENICLDVVKQTLLTQWPLGDFKGERETILDRNARILDEKDLHDKASLKSLQHKCSTVNKNFFEKKYSKTFSPYNTQSPTTTKPTPKTQISKNLNSLPLAGTNKIEF